MATWIINIEPGPGAGDPFTFVPQLQPPGPANVSAGDLVSWFNNTNIVCQPEATDSTFTNPVNAPRGSGLYLSDPINPNETSRPSWQAVAPSDTQNTVYYRCKNRPTSHGTIIVT